MFAQPLRAKSVAGIMNRNYSLWRSDDSTTTR
jgi:hypothetical protein